MNRFNNLVPFFSRTKKAFFKEEGDRLVCGDQKISFENGIPRFVESGAYASLFGDQWKAFKKTQLDSETKTPITGDRLDRCLGPLNATIAGKTVLETGCGAGRFTEVLLKKKAILVSSDISSAVEVNSENFPASAEHQIIQADINDMPYQDESFDIVVCLGVIQHTPNPEETIRNLYSLVKKGGYLVIDHYTFMTSWLFRTAWFYRRYLKRKPPTYTIPYVYKLIDRYLPLHKKYANNKFASVILNRISPIVSYYSSFPELNEAQQKEWALLDTHDSLTDWYKRLRTRGSIRKTLVKLGAEDIWCEYGGNGVEARCKKPS